MNESCWLASVCSVVSLILTASSWARAAKPAREARDIGSRRELFVDRYLIERFEGAGLRLHHPVPAGVAIRYDRPWEGRFSFYSTVLRDGIKFHMYYRGQPNATGPASVCYAESDNGITWRKPELGLVEFEGSKANNIILAYAGGGVFAPFLDDRPGVPPDERFKANHERQEGLMGLVSADGIHWKPVAERVLVPRTLKNHFDSQNVMFWSAAEKQYVLYARHMEGGRRATARATSPDFLSWSPPTLMTYSDTESTVPSDHLYTCQVEPYFRSPELYISLPGRFMSQRRALTAGQAGLLDLDPGGGGAEDISEGAFVTSRAGTTRFDRTFLEGFVRPGVGYGHWVSRSNYPARGIVPTGPAEMSLYVQRKFGQPDAYLERLILRPDGFASVEAPFAGGEMLTKPLYFSGASLEINYATGAAGSIRVELQSAAGEPLAGFALDDSPEIIGDELERVVTWNKQSSLKELAGQPIRIRFVLRDANLYSLRFR